MVITKYEVQITNKYKEQCGVQKGILYAAFFVHRKSGSPFGGRFFYIVCWVIKVCGLKTY